MKRYQFVVESSTGWIEFWKKAFLSGEGPMPRYMGGFPSARSWATERTGGTSESTRYKVDLQAAVLQVDDEELAGALDTYEKKFCEEADPETGFAPS